MTFGTATAETTPEAPASSCCKPPPPPPAPRGPKGKKPAAAHPKPKKPQLQCVKAPIVVRSNFDPKTPWPTKTGLWCWWCCHPFDSYPVAIPMRQDQRTKQYQVFGNFCSWSCAKAYNFMGGLGGNAGNRASLMLSIRLKVFGEKDPVNMAPSRTALKVFGGYLTIEEFRKCSNRAKVIEQKPPFVYFPTEFYIHELRNDDDDDDLMEDLPEGYSLFDHSGHADDAASEVSSCDGSVTSNPTASGGGERKKKPAGGVAPMPLHPPLVLQGTAAARKRKAASGNILAALQGMAKRQ